MDLDAKRRELADLQIRVRQLEAEISATSPSADRRREWPPPGFYAAYHVLAGSVLGFVGAAASLLFNVIGALATGQPPLKLIQVYLSFPMGASYKDLDGGLALAIGCCLYLLTGMVLGVPFQLILVKWFDRSAFATRFIVVTLLSIALWAFNFYGILSWLQPALFGGNWIVEEIPWFVGLATHLVFGWTMLFIQPWGQFTAYSLKPEAQ
ncbi:MAG: hypothetical protein U0744_13460 [Gemmataceae bacterium]